MLIRRPPEIRSSEITPKSVYLDRRRFLVTSAAGLALSATTRAASLPAAAKSPLSTTEKPNSLKEITTYNNFYELGTDKGDPARNAGRLKTHPWSVKIEGQVNHPLTLDIDGLLKVATLEERIYRHRCVERWSIVVPWTGYSLSELIKKADPTSKAKYVAFESFYHAGSMLSSGQAGIEFPYVEGLRLDEAMHPLSLLCFGLYGETLPNQNGAPVRLIVPWKYGFKSIKSIVKIKLTEKQPPATWNLSNPGEYGFYSNVNPDKDHPRWSQKAERRLGEFRMRPTAKFNGYDQVASLYNGMDLNKYY